jgi:hypothetical protein
MFVRMFIETSELQLSTVKKILWWKFWWFRLQRVIQHEYDHIEGILFTDKISLWKNDWYKKLKKHYRR